VIGPVLDAIVARSEGTSPSLVLSRGNKLVASLPWSVRIAFWLTNLPYFALAARLCVSAELHMAHCVAVCIVATASTCFHGAVLFGTAISPRLAPKLMVVDLIAANGYGLVLMALKGAQRVLLLFAAPVGVLTLSAVMKRRQMPHAYAMLHGAWHLLSAAASESLRLCSNHTRMLAAMLRPTDLCHYKSLSGMASRSRGDVVAT